MEAIRYSKQLLEGRPTRRKRRRRRRRRRRPGRPLDTLIIHETANLLT
jgi:hypothetical protein